MTATARRVLKTHPAEPIIGVTEVKRGRIRAERLAAAPAWIGRLVGGDGLVAEASVGGTVATLGGGGAAALMGGAPAALAVMDEGGAAGL